MVVRCYSCGKRFKSDLQECNKCSFVNLKKLSWLPEDLKKKHGENHRPKFSEPNTKKITSLFTKAGKECGFDFETLDVKDDFGGVLEVLQPEDNYKKITLGFNPRNLSVFSDEQIHAMLRHEVMHPITMKESSKVLVQSNDPAIQNFQAEVQYSYDEMINYKEYIKLFPNDPDLHSAKLGMFSNFSVIFLTTKYQIEQGIQATSILPYVQALIIYQDAVYNLFEEKKKITTWADEVNGHAMIEFWRWINEDFDLIHNNTSTRDEMREIIFLTTNMIPTVEIYEIYTSNVLQFNQFYTSFLAQAKTQFTSNLALQLISLWETRFSKCPMKFP